MSKIKYITLLFQAIVICCFQNVYAYDFCVDNIYYNILSHQDRTCEVTSNPDKYEDFIKIPSFVTYGYETYKVVAIGDNAFNERSYDRGYLKSVSLPNTIERIGISAFYCCGLYEINIPNSVKIIDNNAFAECICLLSVEIPKSVEKIGRWAFHGCLCVKNISFLTGENELEIDGLAFSSNTHSDLNLFIGRPIIFEDDGQLPLSPIRIDISDEIDIENVFKSTFISSKVKFLKLGKNNSGIPKDLSAFTSLIHLNIQDDIPFECPVFSEEQYNSIKLIVPDGAIDSYRKSDGWKNFTDIEEASNIKDLDIYLFGSMADGQPKKAWKFTSYNKEATVYKIRMAVGQRINITDDFVITTDDWSTICYGLPEGHSPIAINQITQLVSLGDGKPCQLDSEWYCECWLDISSGLVVFSDNTNYVPDFEAAGVTQVNYEETANGSEIYNIQGIKLNKDQIPHGLYIIKENNKIKKVLKK